MNTWKEITTDHTTGHVIAKDLFKAWAFFGGYVYLLALVPAVFLLSAKNLLLPPEPGYALLTLSFGVQGLKMAGEFLNRKTRDSDGALAAPKEQTPPEGPKPELMPQEATPTPTAE